METAEYTNKKGVDQKIHWVIQQKRKDCRIKNPKLGWTQCARDKDYNIALSKFEKMKRLGDGCNFRLLQISTAIISG